MRQQMDVDTLWALMEREHLHLRDEIVGERRIVKQRFKAGDRALSLSAQELFRRLDTLNHAHEQAREKERDFISRESFDTFTVRTADDFSVLRREIQTTSNQVSAAREGAAQALAEALSEQAKAGEARFGRLESAQARMIGGLALAVAIMPILTVVIVYFVYARH